MAQKTEPATVTAGAQRRSTIRGPDVQGAIQAARSSHNKHSLTVYELYEETNKAVDLASILGASAYIGSQLVDEVLVNALDTIVENEFKKKVPWAVVQTLDTFLVAGLELHYKEYDKDTEADLKIATGPDDEPMPIPVDTWARANVGTRNSNFSVAGASHSPQSARTMTQDHREATRREIRQATERAHKYLTEIDEKKIPKPIPLNEKVDDIPADEIEARLKKERQLKEKKEKEKRDAEAEQKRKDQEKMIAQAQKNATGENPNIITFDYEGQLIIANPKAAKEKLNNVVHPTKIAVKNPEVEGPQLPGALKTHPSDKSKTEPTVGGQTTAGTSTAGKKGHTLPGLKKLNKNALLEDMMQKSAQVAPNISDVITLASGVSLLQNGRTKTNPSKPEFRFNQTGTLRLNKTDYLKMIEMKRIAKEKRLGEARKGMKDRRKDNAGKDDQAEQTRKQDMTDQMALDDDELPYESQSMKVPSLKNLRALRELVGPDKTFTTFNNTAYTDAAKRNRDRESARAGQDQFLQTNTDTFNMELMRGMVETQKSSVMAMTLGVSLKPNRETMIESKKNLESKLVVLPRNRSQKVLRPTRNIGDLMTPPIFGGNAGHQLFSSKTVANFFKT